VTPLWQVDDGLALNLLPPGADLPCARRSWWTIRHAVRILIYCVVFLVEHGLANIRVLRRMSPLRPVTPLSPSAHFPSWPKRTCRAGVANWAPGAGLHVRTPPCLRFSHSARRCGICACAHRGGPRGIEPVLEQALDLSR